MAREARAQRRRERATPVAAQQQRSVERRPAEPVSQPRGSFVSEAWAELKKVDWPGQSQVIQATVVVLVACVVVGAYLYGNDALWKPVVQRIIGQ